MLCVSVDDGRTNRRVGPTVGDRPRAPSPSPQPAHDEDAVSNDDDDDWDEIRSFCFSLSSRRHVWNFKGATPPFLNSVVIILLVYIC